VAGAKKKKTDRQTRGEKVPGCLQVPLSVSTHISAAWSCRPWVPLRHNSNKQSLLSTGKDHN